MGTYYPSHNYGPEHAAAIGGAPRKPVSEKQLEANRRNALKSTGPRTDEGKAVCSQNAFRHGITGQVSVKTDEDRAAHATFTAAIVADLKPAGALEAQLAFAIADSHWRLNRIRASEDNIFAMGHFTDAANIEVDNAELHGALTQARVFLESSRDLERLTLYEQRIQRGIEKNMRELEALQTKRAAAREKALEDAASLLQLADSNEEPAPNGSEFSTPEIRAHIRRKQLLSRAAQHERAGRSRQIERPSAA